MINPPLPIPLEPRLNAKKVKKAKYLLLLKKKYRDLVAYSRIPEARRIAYSASMLTDDEKLFYVKNSKAGCTTIGQILYNYSKGVFCEQNIHDQRWNVKQYEEHWRSFENALNGSAVAFTFVRDPESRLISAFQNFFIDRKNRSRDIHLPALESRGFYDGNSQNKNFGIFLDYVEESLETDPFYTDRHWRPQHINIAANDIRYDIIGKLENFQSDIEKVFSLVGKADLIKENIDYRYNVSSNGTLSLTLNDKHRIRRLYIDDYNRFGY